MTSTDHICRISGVAIVPLASHPHERGPFVETYRQEWFPGRPAMVQANRSDSKAGVVRALHYHLRQADYWYAPSGRIFVGLYDLRRSSPTSGRQDGVEIGSEFEAGVYIPPGVAHGYAAVTDCTLTYMVDRYYD